MTNGKTNDNADHHCKGSMRALKKFKDVFDSFLIFCETAATLTQQIVTSVYRQGLFEVAALKTSRETEFRDVRDVLLDEGKRKSGTFEDFESRDLKVSSERSSSHVVRAMLRHCPMAVTGVYHAQLCERDEAIVMYRDFIQSFMAKVTGEVIAAQMRQIESALNRTAVQNDYKFDCGRCRALSAAYEAYWRMIEDLNMKKQFLDWFRKVDFSEWDKERDTLILMSLDKPASAGRHAMSSAAIAEARAVSDWVGTGVLDTDRRAILGVASLADLFSDFE
eukprot:Selendium_serpulae@DN5410_c0_g1_i1.p1